MKLLINERNIVIVLFVAVLISFSLAQEDSRRIEKAITGETVNVLKGELKDQQNLPADTSRLSELKLK